MAWKPYLLHYTCINLILHHYTCTTPQQLETLFLHNAICSRDLQYVKSEPGMLGNGWVEITTFCGLGSTVIFFPTFMQRQHNTPKLC